MKIITGKLETFLTYQCPFCKNTNYDTIGHEGIEHIYRKGLCVECRNCEKNFKIIIDR